ncbi:MAG: vanadium-dependent haloperoxidase [Bacteroidota bacterium]
MKQIFVTMILCGLIFSCKQGSNKVPFEVNSSTLLHQNQEQLNQVIIYDVFTPPVASRIYAYTSLAFYEAVRFQNPAYPSLTKQLNDFPEMPLPDTSLKYNYNLAATRAFFDVTHKVVFSIDSLKAYENSVFETFRASMDEDEYKLSMAFGQSVAIKILERAGTDNYKQTRGMPKYLGNNDDGKWQPTSPDYMDGVEPYWGKIKPFFLDSSSQCMPPAPPKFSTDKNSEFYKDAMEVYTIGNNLTDSQKSIIRYWDDNPFVMEHSGHMMFANKKITPGGHWMGIAGIAAKKVNADIVKTSEVYALTSIALIESFISCWEAKYNTEVIRPITFINKFIDNRWEPFLQTPPFPEYPSGHSAISAAASTVLTNIFGDNFSFHDDSDKKYIGMEKDFPSFYSAATEAAISRVYGGIHYTSGMEAGIVQGKQVGKQIVNNLIERDTAVQ